MFVLTEQKMWVKILGHHFVISENCYKGFLETLIKRFGIENENMGEKIWSSTFLALLEQATK